MKNQKLFLSLIILSFTFFQPLLAQTIRVKIIGTKTGIFKGSDLVGSPQTINCIGYDYSVNSPVDQTTGTISGKMKHNPVKLIKELDASSPEILHALFTNEDLDITIDFIKTSNGKETIYQTIHLSKARVSEIHQHAGSLISDTPSLKSNTNEEVSFLFKDIYFENKEGKTSASSNWASN